MNRLQVRLGFVLILLALLTGLGVQALANPRLGLASHVVGITGGLVLIALGALARSFALGRRSAKVMMWSWTYAAYANWFGSLLGALTGASRLTPIAGAASTGSPLAENAVAFFLESLALAAIVGTSLAIWGLRGAAATEAAVAAPAQGTGA